MIADNSMSLASLPDVADNSLLLNSEGKLQGM